MSSPNDINRAVLLASAFSILWGALIVVALTSMQISQRHVSRWHEHPVLWAIILTAVPATGGVMIAAMYRRLHLSARTAHIFTACIVLLAFIILAIGHSAAKGLVIGHGAPLEHAKLDGKWQVDLSRWLALNPEMSEERYARERSAFANTKVDIAFPAIQISYYQDVKESFTYLVVARHGQYCWVTIDRKDVNAPAGLWIIVFRSQDAADILMTSDAPGRVLPLKRLKQGAGGL